ncbi:MAG: radical SAM protein [Deltaproteobacteria bacterium]|nr:radical SAM protein [Deltaproteobacteria bacterium]
MKITVPHFVRLLEFRRDLPFPKTVTIDTTNFCNLKCSMCAHKEMQREQGRMEWGLYTKIIDEIAAKAPDTRVLLAFFGEPLLLRKHDEGREDLRSIDSMIRYAKDAGCEDVAINTNGVLLDSEMAHRLTGAGLDRMYVGIDATTSETYDKVRVGGVYSEVVANVRNFLELQQKQPGNRRCYVQVQFIEMDENAHELEGFIKLWKGSGADIKVRKKVTWTGMVDAVSGGAEKGDRHLCYWAMNTLAITHVGDVTMCSADPEARFVAGNVREQSLEEVWTGRMKELRQQHRRGEWGALPFPCNDCDDWSVSFDDEYEIELGIEGLRRLIGLVRRKLGRQ